MKPKPPQPLTRYGLVLDTKRTEYSAYEPTERPINNREVLQRMSQLEDQVRELKELIKAKQEGGTN